MPQKVFGGILNFDNAYFDSRCVECNALLTWEDDSDGFWYTEHCDKRYQIQVYTVIRTIEEEGVLDAIKRTTGGQ